MKCIVCTTENNDTAQFCKNCGNKLTVSIPTSDNENTDKIVNLFMLVIGSNLFVGLFYFVINMLEFIEIYSLSFVTIITNLIVAITTLVAAILMPNQKAKIFLFIAFALEILFFIGYRLL